MLDQPAMDMDSVLSFDGGLDKEIDMESALAQLGARIGADKPEISDELDAFLAKPVSTSVLSSSAQSDDISFDNIAEMMMQSAPEPIPDMFASSPPQIQQPKRRAGMWGLLILILLLVLAAAAAGLYYLQEQVIDIWPPAKRIYEQLHVRNEIVGYGLVFREGASERQVQNGTEVLVVRGVIANTKARAHKIPLIRLTLSNGRMAIQQKVIEPPQAMLDAHSNVGFRITLDQPDPHANGVEVTFAKSNPLTVPAPSTGVPAPESANSPVAPATPSATMALPAKQ